MHETSPAEIARIIIELIRGADRANGTHGRDQLVSFMQHVSSDRTDRTLVRSEEQDDFVSGWKLHFIPEAPLEPDFRFEFEEDREGIIWFSVFGDDRYEGFFLTGRLTYHGTGPIRENWPTPPIIVSAEPEKMALDDDERQYVLPGTSHAKQLRDIFISHYGARCSERC